MLIITTGKKEKLLVVEEFSLNKSQSSKKKIQVKKRFWVKTMKSWIVKAFFAWMQATTMKPVLKKGDEQI
jgi:hypothetical protein